MASFHRFRRLASALIALCVALAVAGPLALGSTVSYAFAAVTTPASPGEQQGGTEAELELEVEQVELDVQLDTLRLRTIASHLSTRASLPREDANGATEHTRVLTPPPES